MNAHPAAGERDGAAAARTRTFALVTASYAPDFERCRLLCETVDAHVEGMAKHYLLVEHGDVARFKPLEGRNRIVVDERDILPSWLRPYWDPTSLWKRRIWLSPRVRPLRGWHVQQLRRIALAAHAEEETLVYCDSDMAFVRRFDCSSQWRGDRLRLFRRDGALLGPGLADQKVWSRHAAVALGLPAAASPHDYVSTLVAWRRDAVLAMCRRIEDVHRRHWVEAVASTRRYSECMLYGRFADEALAGDGHFADATELCRVYWSGPELGDAAFRGFLDAMTHDQVAIGVQSFTGTDIARIRRLIGA